MLTALYIIFGLFILLFTVGILLPKERKASTESIYPVPADQVYRTVSNNEKYTWRNDLKAVNILKKQGDFEIWDEISKKGNSIRFTTTRKEANTLYEFEFKGKGFKGNWKGEFIPLETNKTKFKSTECIRIHNPFIRILSYCFFDMKAQIVTYQQDLNAELNPK